MTIRTYLTSLSVFFAFALSGFAQAAPKSEFRLTVYGMYCNQCAYGVEQTLQHTAGVNDVIVDLRSGNVVVQADSANPPSAGVLVQKVIDQRLSLEKIEATLVGRIVKTTNGWELIAGEQHFNLDTTAGELSLDEHSDQTVTVEGVFEGLPGIDDTEGSPRLVLRTISKV